MEQRGIGLRMAGLTSVVTRNTFNNGERLETLGWERGGRESVRYRSTFHTNTHRFPGIQIFPITNPTPTPLNDRFKSIKQNRVEPSLLYQSASSSSSFFFFQISKLNCSISAPLVSLRSSISIAHPPFSFPRAWRATRNPPFPMWVPGPWMLSAPSELSWLTSSLCPPVVTHSASVSLSDLAFVNSLTQSNCIPTTNYSCILRFPRIFRIISLLSFFFLKKIIIIIYVLVLKFLIFF